jgi:1,4-alpha-glucan branching enzyme
VSQPEITPESAGPSAAAGVVPGDEAGGPAPDAKSTETEGTVAGGKTGKGKSGKGKSGTAKTGNGKTSNGKTGNGETGDAKPEGATETGAGSASGAPGRTKAVRGGAVAQSRSGAGGAAASPAGPRAKPVDDATIDHLVAGDFAQPHSVLGPHLHDGAVTIRVLRPLADSVVVVYGSGKLTESVALTHERGGVWVGVLPVEQVPDYRLDVTYGGHTYRTDDAYRFLPTLGELDMHLVGEGRHEQLWEVLGSHTRAYETLHGTVQGTSFAVWAPNARGVRVVGDFNHWDGRANPLRSLGSTGIWELFVPDVGDYTTYKYEILGRDGIWRQKADPLARHTEVPPATGSKVFTSHYEWGDAAWLERRAASHAHREPMSIYEVHLGSWRWGRSYRDLATELRDYVLDMGFTHVELMPVAEHPFGGSWGYQVSAYFAPTARFGTPDDFRHLVDTLHQAGIGVFVDWVPGHFPRDEWALARFDGTPLYEHPDPRRGEQPDWGTYVFDFGRTEVRNFLVANAVYWLEEFHIDGLRVDAVASMLYLDYSRREGEWLPNQFGGRENLDAIAFLQEANATVYKREPGVVTVAEESTSWPGVSRATHLGGLGFGFKWNMGWMNDSLSYMEREPIYRQYHHHQMTFALVYAYSENFVLPISHDEVVHGKGSMLRKMPGDRWQKLANLRAYYAFMWAHPGKQLLFMGCEIGQEAEWAESRELDWWLLDHPEHRGLQDTLRDLNRIYRATPALWTQDVDPAGFSWIDANDAGGNTFSFLRLGSDGSALACVSNFAAVPHHDYRIGLPRTGRWEEVLNTDAAGYGGSGVGNFGGVEAAADSWHGQPASATIQVPPLATVWFRHVG